MSEVTPLIGNLVRELWVYCIVLRTEMSAVAVGGDLGVMESVMKIRRESIDAARVGSRRLSLHLTRRAAATGRAESP